jgi:toxin ParE1/3/4
VTKSIVQRPAADKDIDSIFEYLHAESPRAAIEFLDAIEHAYNVISAHPQSGSTRHAEFLPELPYPLRFHVVKGFPRVLVYYIDGPAAIEVIRIWDAAQGLDALVTTTEE